MSKDNSGPAFPSSNTPDHGFYAEGMTLRDYFAAKAMQGVIAAKMPITKELDCCGLVAKAAYAQADAMLAERAK